MNTPGRPSGPRQVVHHVVDPFARAGGYYLQTWGRWLRHESRGGVAPIAPHPALALQATIDELVLAMARVGHRPRPPTTGRGSKARRGSRSHSGKGAGG
jgi:hypothetical protein